MRYPFSKSMRLRTHRQYQRMVKGTFKYTGQWILVDIRLSQLNSSRLGITVTRRYGCACERNRFKRLVREAFRLSFPHFNLNFDIVVRPRSCALQANLKDIQEELMVFIQKTSHHKTKENR